MKNEHAAKIKLSIPEGDFFGSKITLNGMDISGYCSGLIIQANVEECRMAMIQLSLYADVEIDGQMLPDVILQYAREYDAD